MRHLIHRLGPALLATIMAVSVLQAMPVFIAPVTIGSYKWKDLDGKCVASCPHLFACPCWPTKFGGFWINVP
jgi:hypothetical protein